MKQFTFKTPEESLAMHNDLRERQLHLDNSFIAKYVNMIAYYVIGINKMAYIGDELICQDWFNQQTENDRQFIEDFEAWMTAKYEY